MVLVSGGGYWGQACVVMAMSVREKLVGQACVVHGVECQGEVIGVRHV